MLSNRLAVFAERIFFTGIQKHHSSCCGITESSCGRYRTVLRTRKDFFFSILSLQTVAVIYPGLLVRLELPLVEHWRIIILGEIKQVEFFYTILTS